MIYLAVVLIIRGVGLLSHFLLAPQTPALRILPLEDSSSLYVHRWVMRLVLVFWSAFLLRGTLELQGISEQADIFIQALTSAFFLSIIVYLLFDNRESVSRIIRGGAGDQSSGTKLLRTQLASFWHLLALPYVVFAWGLWVFYLLVGRHDLVVPVFALISSLPLFFIFNGLGQKLLSTVFGLVDKREAIRQGCEVEAGTDGEQIPEATVEEAAHGADHLGRIVPILRHCLSLSIVGILLFWLLDLWGFEVRLGEQVTGAALKILLILSLAYVAWRLIEDAINRKLKDVQGSVDVDEDSEMGGTGGTRIGTLLQLFRKFLLAVFLVIVGLIVLSAMGIDTKPLVAGAGILGLAIGLGTQNLIKDIVSGLFFLIDDAFRIGDYVESGKAKGTVEAISIRSLKLRHPRGQVHNVPFSQLGMVTNFSRDYNIVKLDFRVPFGSDIDQVRKVVKKINKEIQGDEELGPNLLGSIKFGGVMAFDDSAQVLRVKFKSKPGLQFLVQRQVLRRLQELFDERGLEFATRHVEVRIPEDSTPEREGAGGETPAPSTAASAKLGLSAAAAAAIGTLIADEEAKKKLMEEEKESDK